MWIALTIISAPLLVFAAMVAWVGRDRALARVAMWLLDRTTKPTRDRLVKAFHEAVLDEFYYSVKVPVPPSPFARDEECDCETHV